MRGSGVPPAVRGAAVILLLAIGPTACGGGGSGTTGGAAEVRVTDPTTTAAIGTGTTAAADVDVTTVLAGTHRYDVTHENLGSCTGAAEDRQETLAFTFTTDGLTLANLDFDWSQDFDAVADGAYERTEETSEGYEWRKTLTLSTEGFVMLSETNDPAQVGQTAGFEPCLRYTYRLLD